MALSNEIDLSVEQLPQNPIILNQADESDYNNLANKPKINDIVLKGDKTSSELGLASAEQGEKADSAVQPADLSVYRTSADQDIIDATKATKKELAGYLPLSGGTVTGGLTISRSPGTREALFRLYNESNGQGARFFQNSGSTIIAAEGGTNRLTLTFNSLVQEKDSNSYPILTTLDKAVANGVASLDASAKVPEDQIPLSFTIKDWRN